MNDFIRKCKGGQFAPLTQLKKLPRDKQDVIWSWREEMVGGKALKTEEICVRITEQFQIEGSKEYTVSRFWRWYAERKHKEELNDEMEKREKYIRRKYPLWSDVRVRKDGIRYFMKLTKDRDDVKEFATMARLDQNESFNETRDAQKDRHLDQQDRKIKLLEEKAEAYTRAQNALSEAKNSKGGITPETIRRIEEELRLL